MFEISQGVHLFNDYDFFSAHDFFEDIWMEADKNEKDFFQGMVQISVGCYHLICGNIRGAKSQLTKGRNKLVKFEPSFYDIDLIKLNNKIKLLLVNLANQDATKMLPTIELTS